MVEMVVTTILALCSINSTELTDKDLQCIDYYNNCIVNYGDKVTDTQILQCIKDKNNDSTKKR